MSIGFIIWPDTPAEAIRTYLRFLLKVMAELNIHLPEHPNAPVSITEQWLAGALSDAELHVARDAWWAEIDSVYGIRDLRSEGAVKARLALCLLATRETDAPDLGEHLSWFLELLGFMGADVKKAIAMMREAFSFRAPANGI